MRFVTRLDPEAHRVWQLLVRFFFAQREHLPDLCAAFDLSPAQCHVLHLIEPGRPLPMGHLAEALSCDRSNVTGLVDRLETRGLVRRQPSTRDRRVKVLELTPTGSRVRSEVLRGMTQGPVPLSRLSPGQRRSLVKILEALLDE
jgi:MarR family transcriptional regulator, organic hydroperoxide resistance regulator